MQWYKKKIGSVDSVVEELKQHLKCRGGAGLLGFGEQQTLCTGHSKKKASKCMSHVSKENPREVQQWSCWFRTLHPCIDALIFSVLSCAFKCLLPVNALIFILNNINDLHIIFRFCFSMTCGSESIICTVCTWVWNVHDLGQDSKFDMVWWLWWLCNLMMWIMCRFHIQKRAAGAG